LDLASPLVGMAGIAQLFATEQA